MIYNPEDYWEKRLLERFNLSGVGNVGFSEYYNRWLYKAKIRVLKRVLLSERINIHSMSVCDIGCGTGFFIDFYKLQGAREITGIDIASVCIENLQQKYPEYRFIKNDISSPLLVPKVSFKFDILNVFDVLYHITDDARFEQAIINICSLTNNDGFIFVSDLFGEENVHVAEHVKFRSKNVYENVLSKNGCKIITILPLYHLLNRSIFGKLPYLGIKIDNLLAPIYYLLDYLFISQQGNLNLLVAKKMKP